MATKNINTRIKHKTDTSANWAKAVNFVPLKGEIIVYSDLRKIKVGDGTTKVNSLQFLADSDTHQAVVDKNPTLSWGTKSTVATIGGTGINVTMPANPNTHQSIKTLKTDNTVAQATSASETIAGSGTINLHKVAKTGSYNDLNNKPTIPAAANNGLLTIQRNGANVATFHANQSGDTLANISVPTELSQLGGRTFSNITSRGEEYLEWGGPAKVGDVSPIGMAISSEHSANRIAFINPAALKVEYSSDGGSTWTDYPITGDGTEQKTRLCTKNANYRIGRPDNSTNLIANKSKTRITITGQDGTNQYVYSALKKMLINVSTATALSLLVERRTGTNYESNGTWETVGTYKLEGWSGWNDIPLDFALGGGKNQKSNYWQMRLTITCTTVNSNYPKEAAVLGLRLFGTTSWFPPSTLAETGHLYAYYMDESAEFPANVYATAFREDGSFLVNKYLGKTAQAADSAKLNGQDSSHYLTSIKMNGATKPSTNSTVNLGNVCTYTNSVVENKLSVASKKMEEITWSDLKFLKDSGKLTPGMRYRITDYTATINPSLTEVRSAGHQFDIVVIADGPNTLNENATAVLHGGDTYFKDCDLNSWRLKYCLDNDRSRFQWAADEKDGKGVIYWMEDEFHNKVPYDFKNIMFKRYKVNSVGRNNTFLFDSFFCESSNLKITDCISPIALFGNMANVDDATFIWCYTFCTFDNDDASKPLDASINLFPNGVTVSNYRVRPLLYAFNNTIEPYIVGNGGTNTTKTNYQQLNNIVFMKYDRDSSADTQYNFSVYGNRIKSACHSMTFGRGCSRNTFDSCNNIMFGFGCIDNTISGCTRSVFSYKCSGNSGEQGFSYNLLCNTCQCNRFGGTCQYLELGEKCSSNTFGNDCKYLIVGMSGNSKYNTFEDNVSYVEVGATTNNSNPLQYIIVAKGVSGSGEGSSMLHIPQPRGLSHTVTYQLHGSETIDV